MKCRSQIKIKTQLLSFQGVFIRTKWVKLIARIAAQVLMSPRRNTLEEVQLTAVHALTVRTMSNDKHFIQIELAEGVLQYF